MSGGFLQKAESKKKKKPVSQYHENKAAGELQYILRNFSNNFFNPNVRLNFSVKHLTMFVADLNVIIEAKCGVPFEVCIQLLGVM